jgi:uncharacterized protein (DUF111 family)
VTGHRHAWIDASAGVAGDMLLGALIDAGADPRAVQHTVDTVVPHAVRLASTAVTRAGLRALHVDVQPLIADAPRRTWPAVRGLLTRPELPSGSANGPPRFGGATRRNRHRGLKPAHRERRFDHCPASAVPW